MRNRIISLAIILTLILSFTTAYTYAEEEQLSENVETESQINEEIAKKLDFLHAFGVLTDYTAEATIENSALTRSAFIQMMYGMYTNLPEYKEVNFTDVPENAPYRQALAALNYLNIVVGNENGEFMPDAVVTYEQAIKLATCMLGYKMNADKLGGYYVGYTGIASSLGITKDLTKQESFRFNDAVTLLYNVFECDMFLTEFTGNDKVDIINKPFMEEYCNAYKANGYVESNMYTGVIDKPACGKDSVVIDGITYLDPNGIALNYVGYKVKFYYIEKDDEYTVVYAEPNNNVKIVSFTSKELEKDSSSLSMFNLVYTENQKKTKNIRLAEDVTVIYNGKEYSGFTVDTYKETDGTFIAVSNNNSNVYDTLIIKDYEYYVIDSISTAEEYVIDKFERRLEFEIEDNLETVIWKNADGTEVVMDNIVEWNALAVETSKDGSLMNITVLTDCVEGVVTSVSDDGRTKTLKVNGTEYDISENYVKTDDTDYPTNPPLGVNVFLVLDCSGNVILVDPDSETYRAGVLIRVYTDDDDQMGVKIFGNDGKMSRYNLSSNLSIDGLRYGKSVKKGEAGIDNIVAALQNGDVIKVKKVADHMFENIPNDQLPEDLVYQFIRYILDDDGNVLKIDTAAKDATSNSDELIKLEYVNTATQGGIKMQYKLADGTFGKILATTAQTDVFYIPTPLERNNDSAYAIEKAKDRFKNDGWVTFIPYASNFSEALSMKSMVVIDGYSTNITGCMPTMFDESYETLDEDDTPIHVIIGYQGKTKVTLPVKDSQILIDADLNRGDIFRYALDSSKNVKTIQKYFDLSDKTLYDDNGNENGNSVNFSKNDGGIMSINTGTRRIFADAYSYKSGNIAVSNVYKDGIYTIMEAAAVPENSLMEIHTVSLYNGRYGLVAYDMEDDKITEVKPEDIRTYKKYGNECSKLLIIMNYLEPYLMYIYNP